MGDERSTHLPGIGQLILHKGGDPGKRKIEQKIGQRISGLRRIVSKIPYERKSKNKQKKRRTQ